MYQFDQSIHQWILCLHRSLIADDLKNPFTNDMYIPQHGILKTPETSLLDIIGVQEVTLNFLNLLSNEIWLQENNDDIIIMGNVIEHKRKQYYRQLMLTKNLHAQVFSTCPPDLSEDSSNTNNIK
ncbi:unnamed protein product [Adineta steineri]|uniref:Uncharacterized protein n=1 Tax=Adineta steineri TaxID=433720 RepID=A0A815PU91_9BILA|nr:unnamed protein product [Adineta steineri]CAF4148085.1 unnamed protein product [Adineta steineri]